jgi:hypothetical protein
VHKCMHNFAHVFSGTKTLVSYEFSVEYYHSYDEHEEDEVDDVFRLVLHQRWPEKGNAALQAAVCGLNLDLIEETELGLLSDDETPVEALWKAKDMVDDLLNLMKAAREE